MSFSSTFSFLNTQRLLVFASLAYGFLVWLALPDRVVAIDDDFGYLRSIQETWQHGRPWTHSFLVPFSASTSVLVCLGYAVTGSMAFAVHSHLALNSAVAFAAGLALLRRVGVPLGVGAWVLLIILTAPTVMFMQLMLTSVSLYWACLWVCAWSAFTKRWWIFIPTFFVAIGTRQSALLWLALPGWVVAMEIWKTGGKISRVDWGQTRGPLLSGILGFAAFLAFKWGMNETFAQRHYAAAMKELPGAGALFWIGPAFLLCGCGWGGWLMTLLRRERPSAHRMMIGAVLALLAGALAVHGYSLLSLTHHLVRDPWAKPMLALTGAVGGWGLSGLSRVWVPAIMAGIAGMIPQWLYVSGFDYYYIESFFWVSSPAFTGWLWRFIRAGGRVLLGSPARSLWYPRSFYSSGMGGAG